MAGEPEGSDDPPQAHRHGPVIDELLCFVTNKLSLLPPETIVQLCVSTYNASEIECSKKLLFQLLSDPDMQTRNVKRKGEKRTVTISTTSFDFYKKKVRMCLSLLP